jgi:hypothetical protein
MALPNVNSNGSLAAQNGSGTIAPSGGTALVPNIGGRLNASFEEFFTGTAPATCSITIQGQMRGGTKDAASNTNTTVAASISYVTFAKVYSSFLITATWTGGDGTTVFNYSYQMGSS